MLTVSLRNGLTDFFISVPKVCSRSRIANSARSVRSHWRISKASACILRLSVGQQRRTFCYIHCATPFIDTAPIVSAPTVATSNPKISFSSTFRVLHRIPLFLPSGKRLAKNGKRAFERNFVCVLGIRRRLTDYQNLPNRICRIQKRRIVRTTL